MMSDVDGDRGCCRVLVNAVRPVPELGYPSKSTWAVAMLREGPHLWL